MSKCLITYFSPTGTTRRAAMRLSERLKSDLFEIVPAQSYSLEDLNWSDADSRTSRERMNDACRPLIHKLPDVSDYEDIYIGYPIWWYHEPRIIDSLLDLVDLKGKRVHLFATSGGSTVEQSRKHIEKLYPQLQITEATLMKEEQLW